MSYRILVVEDDREIRDGIGIYLKNQGYEVVKAANGAEGLAALRENEIHLAIVDIMMPVMGGLQATEKIRSMERADAKTVSILAMTAQANSESSSECRKAGMNDYIEKPIEAEKLWEIISKNLTEKTL